MGHASFDYIKRLFPSMFENIDSSIFRCDVCELAKSHRTSFRLTLNKSPLPFMVIHSDVWGPSKIQTLGGSRWFVTFIDDCTRMTWLWLMKSKSEVNLLFQKFHKMIKTQYNAQIQVLRSDNGGEYQSSELQHFFEVEGIINQTTCSNTPEQNGVAERKNRHLLEVVRAILIEANMPLSYWGEALAFAVYSINRTPSRSIEYQTPLKALSDVSIAPSVPNLPLRIFGCVVFVHLHKHQRSKLAPRALRCVFLGYAMHKKGYRCYHPPTQRMFITIDVVFHEELMYFSPKAELQGKYQKEYDPITCLDVHDTSVLNLDLDINSNFRR
jgi:transposase InsO family protein